MTERGKFAQVFRVEPKYMLLGGVIGAFITYTVIRSMDTLGPARAVMLIVVAQLAVAYGIELFGIFGVEKQPWEFHEGRLIGEILGRYQLGLGDSLIALRIEEFISRGMLTPTTEPMEDRPIYHRYLRKEHHHEAIL